MDPWGHLLGHVVIVGPMRGIGSLGCWAVVFVKSYGLLGLIGGPCGVCAWSVNVYSPRRR